MNGPTKRLPQGEFIALMAMVAATVAFSIDAMLPALPEMGAQLSPDNLNRAQLIITSFVPVSYTHLTLPTNREV